ncbi:MAG: hypothetical protein S4CHLAM2_17860 [Chlamydiales bacterium]|nr:hypothetical protein [Chlamydiales bacterium]
MQKDLIELVYGKQGRQCCDKIHRIHTRFPHLYPEAEAQTTLRMLAHVPESFLSKRSDSLILRMLSAHCRHAKQMKAHPSAQLQLFTRILSTHKSTCGIVISTSYLNKYEWLTEDRIIDSIQHLVSGVRTVEESILNFSELQTEFFYIEIKKMRGGYFSPAEINKLAVSIETVLQKKIEQTLQPIALPEIEESSFKYITLLSKELTQVNDIPQIIISFSEYFEHKVAFVVILVRVMKERSESIATLISRAPSSIEIVLEKSLIVDVLHKHYPKEASILRFQLNSSLCERENKINLRDARQSIKKVVENTFGQVRDYNGGLIVKEDEQLTQITNACSQASLEYFFLEDLFYNIKPNYMRAIVSTHTYLDLLQLVEKCRTKEIEQASKYYIDSFSSEQAEIVVVKTSQPSWLTQLPPAILSASSSLCSTHLREGKYDYLCFFGQGLEAHFSLQKCVENSIEEVNNKHNTHTKSILRLNLQGGDPSSLNPRLASDIHCHTLCNLLFEGLTRVNEKGEPEPALAKKIEVDSSGLQYTFHLRESAWSNGKEVSAYDFERSWKKALMDSVPSFLCPKLFFHIKNAEQAREGLLPKEAVMVRAQDHKTLYVHLEAPCHYFLHLVATPLFFPLFGDSEEPKYFNGPYDLGKWEHNSSISLSRNPFYWDSKSLKINGMIFDMESDIEKTYEKFANHELDIIGDPLSPLSFSQLEATALKHTLVSKQISRIFWIHCNIHSFPLQNKRIRQALNISLNRKKIATETFYKQLPHSSPLPVEHAHTQLNLEGDPEQARALFTKALQELNMDRESFPPLELIHSNLAFEKNLAAELKKQWKEVLGITLITKELPWNEFSSSLEKGLFQLGGLFRRDLFNHPQYYLNFFRSSSRNPHSLNHEEFENLFNQIDKNQNDLDPIKEIEKLLLDEAPVFPLLCQISYGLAHEHIKGVDWHLNGCLKLDEVFFDQEIPPLDRSAGARDSADRRLLSE